MEKIGRYQILKVLGSGGFGVVYLGHDEVIQRDLAIKVFKPKDENLIAFATSSDEEGLQILRERFLREARILARLESNPHVINVIEFGELDDGAPWYAMPYVRGHWSMNWAGICSMSRRWQNYPQMNNPAGLPWSRRWFGSGRSLKVCLLPTGQGWCTGTPLLLLRHFTPTPLL